MRRALFVVAMLAMSGPLYADKHDDAKSQVAFGIQVAQKGLWKEALLRFQHAVELDPNYAQAWCDLAIGYEQAGNFPEARTAYEKALAIDHDDQYIRQNYDAFIEVYDRQQTRQNRRGGG